MELSNHILPRGYTLESYSQTYMIERKLGQGGFGITYLASFTQRVKAQVAGNLSSFDEDAEQQIKVVIKEFYIKDISSRNEHTAMVTFGSSTGQGRFVDSFKQKMRKEAYFLSRLYHPNIAKVSEVFEANNTVYIVMQYIRGESLIDRINHLKKIPVNDAVRYTLQICDALEEVHRNNILHLDIKPGNILLDKQDNAKLIDFGISKQYNDKNEETSHSILGKSDGYAPIEQYAESGVAFFSPSTDIYALGATLYCMLTGVKPIPAPTRMHTELDAPVTLNPEIPQPLSDVVMKAMDIFAKKRYQNVAEFKTDMEDTKENGEDIVIDDKVFEGIEIKLPGSDTQIDTLNPQTEATQRIKNINSNYFQNHGGHSETLIEQEIDINNIPLVYVSGGSFTMGCTAEQNGDCDDDEKPAHQVTLDDFYIGRYEVTQAQWKAVMDNNPSFFRGDNLPVENVGWNDVQEFVRRLNKKTGKNYRLPTEAEWEFVARGGMQSRGYKYSGSNNADDVAWYGNNSGGKTHPVGQKQANELGLYDMSGNVYEWCSDWYGKYSSNSQTNPTGSITGSGYVIRGGCWNFSVRVCRVSNRDSLAPGNRIYSLSFRLACNSCIVIDDKVSKGMEIKPSKGDTQIDTPKPQIDANEELWEKTKNDIVGNEPSKRKKPPRKENVVAKTTVRKTATSPKPKVKKTPSPPIQASQTDEHICALCGNKKELKFPSWSVFLIATFIIGCICNIWIKQWYLFWWLGLLGGAIVWLIIAVVKDEYECPECKK
jgi:formylglycine-generating enzyme required for sulfatase activity